MSDTDHDATPQVRVTDSPAQSRWEARIDGELAGVAVYVRDGDVVTFVHTETDPRFGGQGVGGALARTALDAVRADGLTVVPQCPFIAGWIRKHPDYADLVTHD